MRIGIDYRMGGINNAGIGRYISELLLHLLKIDKENTYVIFYRDENMDQAHLKMLGSFANAELVAANIRHYSLGEQYKLIKLLNKSNLDVVHFPNFNVPILYKKPFVTTIHDMVHHKISGHKKSRYWKFLAYKKVMDAAAKNSKKIITVSEAAKKDIVNILQIPENKIQVVYEGVALKEVGSEIVEQTKKDFMLSKPYFLFVGTLERKKNVVSLAKAFDMFIEKYKLDIDLVIAGKVDPHYPEIKHQAMAIKNKNRLIFTGFITDEQLTALYQGAFAFVSSSLHEGFGLPGIEAMRFGLPLVVSNLEVFNEVYDNAAVYFDPKNISDISEKIKLLASDRQFYEQMQEKALKRGAVFEWENTAKETLQVYKEALNS